MSNCVSCGTEFRSPFKRAKRCMPCRCLVDLVTSPPGKRDCPNCGKSYFPIRRTHKQCYTCSDIRVKMADNPYKECKLCGKKHRIAPGLTDTCIECVQSSREFRDSYRKRLEARLTELTAAKSDVTSVV